MAVTIWNSILTSFKQFLNPWNLLCWSVFHFGTEYCLSINRQKAKLEAKLVFTDAAEKSSGIFGAIS